MKIHDLKPAPGSNRAKRRVGRGIAGKGGKTAGRGTKGQSARGQVPVGFEGGQLPMAQRVPKLKGFNNPFRVAYKAINLDTIADLGLDVVDPAALRAAGISAKKDFIKVLGRGQLNGKVTVRAHAFSQTARAAIEAAGGTVEIVPLPFGDNRRPVQGNQHANR